MTPVPDETPRGQAAPGVVRAVAAFAADGRLQVRGKPQVLAGALGDRPLVVSAVTGAPLLLAAELVTAATLAAGLRRGDSVALLGPSSCATPPAQPGEAPR